MTRYELVLLIIALFAATYVTADTSEDTSEDTDESSERRCPKNQVWTECGSRCEPGCPSTGRPRPCTLECVPKCSCKRGYVKGPNGKCIRRNQCPVVPKCGLNQVWNECGSNCEERCQPDGRVCAAVCVKKCSCKSGYVIGPDGVCIKKDQCPKQIPCGDDKRWTDCGSYCEPSCDDDPANPRMCPAVCVAKCVCKEGLILNKEGKCVLKKDCKKHG